MDNFSNTKAYYYLRSLPICAAALVYLIILRIYPEFVGDLHSYIVDSNPEEHFSQYGWSLYYIIIPFCIAATSRIEYHWSAIIALVVYPIALCLSYWLWELLGWVVMGVTLFGTVGLVSTDDRNDTAHKIYLGVITTACVLYAIVRVFFSSHLLGIADIGFPVLIGGYLVITAIIDVFKIDIFTWENRQETIVRPAGITMLYILILSVAMMLMDGGELWKTISLSGAERKKYNTFIVDARNAQQDQCYRDAANNYIQAADIRAKQRNLALARTMNHKADSIESVLVKSIPQDLNKLKKEKRNSSTFNEHADEIERDIKLLESNASRATPKNTINYYKKRLEAQRKRKR